jgi:odorant receptor
MVDLVELSDFFQFPFKCFSMLGLNLLKNDTALWKCKLRKIYHQAVMANLFKTIIMVAMYIKENIGDLVLITENAPSSGTAALAYVKIACFTMALNDFQHLVETLKEVFPKTRRDQELYNVRKYANDYKRVERVMYLMFFSVVAVWIFVPILKFVVFGISITKLPYDNWFPFNQYDPDIFPFVVGWQFISTILAMLAVAGPDLMFYALNTILCMQFDILCHKLRALRALPMSEIEEKLVDLVELHSTLLDLTKDLNAIFSLLIFIHFIIGTIWICIVGFQVLAKISLENFLKFSDILAVFCLGVFLLCFYGQKLTTASDNVADAIYDFPWDDKLNRKHRSLFMMMLRRAQKPNFVSAQKFFPVSLQAFTSVSD